MRDYSGGKTVSHLGWYTHSSPWLQPWHYVIAKKTNTWVDWPTDRLIWAANKSSPRSLTLWIILSTYKTFTRICLCQHQWSIVKSTVLFVLKYCFIYFHQFPLPISARLFLGATLFLWLSRARPGYDWISGSPLKSCQYQWYQWVPNKALLNLKISWQSPLKKPNEVQLSYCITDGFIFLTPS